MKTQTSYLLRVSLAGALLAGCGGGSQLPIAAPQNAAQSLRPQGSGIIDEAGKYSIVHAFRNVDGILPDTLIRHDAELFGETLIGGSKTCDCGVVFKLSPAGGHYTFTILHAFAGGSSDGANPFTLAATRGGALYGTTGAGGGSGCSYTGSVGCGVVWKLTPSGSGYAYGILYRFKSYAGGYGPGLVRGQTLSDGGSILGTALGGASKTCSCGIIFKLVRSGNAYTSHVLWNFRGNPGLGGPTSQATVIDGKIYGAAYGAGDVDSYAYRFDSGHLTVLHEFRQSDAKDGTNATLTASDPAGNLYGSAGGGLDRCFIGKFRTGCGLAYELVAAGGKYTERVLQRFSPGSDGWGPGISTYHNGTLYGRTDWGGNVCDGQRSGCGVIFALSASTGKETVLYRFVGGFHGAFGGDLVLDPSENVFYGTTSHGGYHDAGTVFQLVGGP